MFTLGFGSSVRSIKAGFSPDENMFVRARNPFSNVPNEKVLNMRASGIGNARSVAFVMMPKNPSDPTNTDARDGPTELFSTDLVCKMSPDGKTTSNPRT